MLAHLKVSKIYDKNFWHNPHRSTTISYSRLGDTANLHALWKGTYLKKKIVIKIMQNMLYLYICLSSLLKWKKCFFRNARHIKLILASWRALPRSFCLHAAYCSRDICVPSYGSQCHWSVSFCALSGWTWLSSAGDKYHIQKASHPCGHVCGSRICLDNEIKSVSMNCNRYHLQQACLGFVL